MNGPGEYESLSLDHKSESKDIVDIYANKKIFIVSQNDGMLFIYKKDYYGPKNYNLIHKEKY